MERLARVSTTREVVDASAGTPAVALDPPAPHLCDSLVSRSSPSSPPPAPAASSPHRRRSRHAAAAPRLAPWTRSSPPRRSPSGSTPSCPPGSTASCASDWSRGRRRAPRSPSAGTGGSCTSRATAPPTTRRARPPSMRRTIYDLASLTKVVATTTAAMILEEEGKLDLSRTVQSYLPEFDAPDKAAITVRMLLTHRGGLEAFAPLWKERAAAPSICAQINARPLANPPGTKMVYSDWDFVLHAGRRRAHHRHDARCVRRRARVRAARDASTRASPRHDRRGADARASRRPRSTRCGRPAARHGARPERVGARRRLGTRRPVLHGARSRRVRADAARTAARTRACASSTPTTIARWTAPQDPALEPRARLGHAVATSSSAGRYFSPRSFGHTGFTGTSHLGRSRSADCSSCCSEPRELARRARRVTRSSVATSPTPCSRAIRDAPLIDWEARRYRRYVALISRPSARSRRWRSVTPGRRSAKSRSAVKRAASGTNCLHRRVARRSDPRSPRSSGSSVGQLGAAVGRRATPRRRRRIGSSFSTAVRNRACAIGSRPVQHREADRERLQPLASLEPPVVARAEDPRAPRRARARAAAVSCMPQRGEPRRRRARRSRGRRRRAARPAPRSRGTARAAASRSPRSRLEVREVVQRDQAVRVVAQRRVEAQRFVERVVRRVEVAAPQLDHAEVHRRRRRDVERLRVERDAERARNASAPRQVVARPHARGAERRGRRAPPCSGSPRACASATSSQQQLHRIAWRATPSSVCASRCIASALSASSPCCLGEPQRAFGDARSPRRRARARCSVCTSSDRMRTMSVRLPSRSATASRSRHSLLHLARALAHAAAAPGPALLARAARAPARPSRRHREDRVARALHVGPASRQLRRARELVVHGEPLLVVRRVLRARGCRKSVASSSA